MGGVLRGVTVHSLVNELDPPGSVNKLFVHRSRTKGVLLKPCSSRLLRINLSDLFMSTPCSAGSNMLLLMLMEWLLRTLARCCSGLPMRLGPYQLMLGWKTFWDNVGGRRALGKVGRF